MTEENISMLGELDEELPPQEEKAEKAEISETPLFAALLRDVVSKLWEGDIVMAQFVEHVAAPLSDELGCVAAKGGLFAEEHLRQGKARVADYIQDQSMRAHLINGLFPVLHLARTLHTSVRRRYRAAPAFNPRPPMLRYSLLFLVIALLAGVFGFTEVAGPSYLIAKVFFFVFLLLFVLSLFFGRRGAVDAI